MSYRVIFTPEAEAQLVSLYHYIAEKASPDIAARYAEAIVSHCEKLCTFPSRGTIRDDVRPGLHVTNYKKPAVIAFTVTPSWFQSSACSTAARTTKPSCRKMNNNEGKRDSSRQDTLKAWEECQATSLHATAEEVDAWLASWREFRGHP